MNTVGDIGSPCLVPLLVANVVNATRNLGQSPTWVRPAP